MQDSLKLSTLGGLEVWVGDARISGLGGKAAALLVYLACTGRVHPREALGDLLWDGRDAAQGRTNLRILLSRLPQALPPFLLVTRETLGWNPAASLKLDLADIELHLGQAQAAARIFGPTSEEAVTDLQAAVSLYGGPFLQGLYLSGAGGFETWMLSEQERLGRQMTGALHHLVAAHLERGEHGAGVRQANRLLDLDPLDEEARRQLMRLLSAQGQRGAALRQYELWCQRLSEDLGSEPAAETQALAEQIRAGKRLAPGSPAPQPPALPRAPTRFVGREAELTGVAERLNDPACQCLTLVGPGGSGKTRLALEVAGRVTCPDGTFFVPLVEVEAPEGVVPAIAGAVGLTTRDGAGVRGWLRGRQVLLVLDNFEHLGGAAPLLSELLQGAPGLKLLVTSREALHLHAEWLFDLGGMPLPRTDSAADIEGSGAVRLFVQSARRAQAHFALDEANTADAVRICRLVGGSPLGIELAAAWVRFQDCATIAGEIERDLDFLASPLRDVPERHRSMRAVFEYSWALLSGAEREGLRRLSVFRGGFEVAAAREVAGVSVALLAALLDRSLLGRTGGTRYELHELLRQFAGEKLAEHPEEQAALRARYVTYYERVAADISLGPSSISPEAWARREEPELDNLRAALGPGPPGGTPGEAARAPSDDRARPFHVEAGVTIARPLEEVFAFAANIENDPRWLRYSSIVEVRCAGREPPEVGTGFEYTIRLFGRRARSAAVITESVPNARISYHSTTGPIRYHSRRVFEAVPGGIRLTRVDDIDTSGAFRLVQVLAARVTRRALELDLEYLKHLLETRGATSSGHRSA